MAELERATTPTRQAAPGSGDSTHAQVAQLTNAELTRALASAAGGDRSVDLEEEFIGRLDALGGLGRLGMSNSKKS